MPRASRALSPGVTGSGDREVELLLAAAEIEDVSSEDGSPDLAALRADEDLAERLLGRISGAS